MARGEGLGSLWLMIEVNEVYKVFPAAKGEGEAPVRAVDGVSFCCQPGRVFALLGPNGSGKTTLLRIIASLMTADTGQVKVAGLDCARHGGRVREKLGFLTGSAGLHGKLSPLETLEFFGRLQGLAKVELQQRIEESVMRFELGEFLKRPCDSLSMGQKQRVMIARTMIHDPEVLVFDEATTGLDVLSARSLIELIRSCRDAGKTVLFSTHIMGEVGMLADDVTILHHGKQVFNGTFEALKSGTQAETLEDEFIRLLDSASAEEEVWV